MKKARITGTVLILGLALAAVLFLWSLPASAFARESIQPSPPEAGLVAVNHDPLMKLVEITMLAAGIAGFAIRNRFLQEPPGR
jgi:hypothetical protein